MAKGRFAAEREELESKIREFRAAIEKLDEVESLLSSSSLQEPQTNPPPSVANGKPDGPANNSTGNEPATVVIRRALKLGFKTVDQLVAETGLQRKAVRNALDTKSIRRVVERTTIDGATAYKIESDSTADSSSQEQAGQSVRDILERALRERGSRTLNQLTDVVKAERKSDEDEEKLRANVSATLSNLIKSRRVKRISTGVYTVSDTESDSE